MPDDLKKRMRHCTNRFIEAYETKEPDLDSHYNASGGKDLDRYVSSEFPAMEICGAHSCSYCAASSLHGVGVDHPARCLFEW